MKVGFDGGIKLEFHGAKVTSYGGLLAYRDIDQDSSKVYQAQQIHHVSDGRGYHRQEVICRDIVSD